MADIVVIGAVRSGMLMAGGESKPFCRQFLLDKPNLGKIREVEPTA